MLLMLGNRHSFHEQQPEGIYNIGEIVSHVTAENVMVI
jgi:hypothetical protein